MYELKQHKDLKRRQKYEMGAEAYQHYKWYNSILQKELRLKPEAHYKLKIFHWYIESSNIQAFTIDDVLYKAMSVIISPTVEYWYGANAGRGVPHTWGSRPRPLENLQAVIRENSSLMSLTNTTQLTRIPRIVVTTEKKNNFEMICSSEFCANNCDECKGQQNPSTLPRKPKCACYIMKKNGKYRETATSSDQQTSVRPTNENSNRTSLSEAIAVLNQKKNILRRSTERRVLNTINE